MAEVQKFNYDLDKITEREVVFDFVSRLNLGKPFINPDYNQNANNNDDKQIIFPSKYKLKDEVLANMIRTMDTSHIHHLDTIKTAYVKVEAGDNEAVIIEPSSEYKLYRIIQEKTGYDVTECFTYHTLHDGSYVAIFDVPATHTEYYKAYFYKE